MLSIIIAVFAYSLIDAAKTIQKVGIHTWQTSRLKGGLIWFAGIAGGTVSSFLILYAVSIGSVILVGSLAGTGMVAMLLIARITLNEKVGPLQIAAVGTIVAGPFLMAGASRYSVTMQFQPPILWLFIAVLVVPCVIGIFIFLKRRGLGVILAITGGVLSGLVIIFQKLAGSPIGQQAALAFNFPEQMPELIQTVLKVLFNPYSAAWIFLSVIATAALQFAHRIEMAVRSIPVLNAGAILTPVLAGLFVFSEHLTPLQWSGVASIFIGIVILIARPPKTAETVVY